MPIKRTIAQILGDNLGVHTILGFMDSFSANYFCRLRLIDKVLSQEVFSEDDPRLIVKTKVPNEEHYADLSEEPTLTSSH